MEFCHNNPNTVRLNKQKRKHYLFYGTNFRCNRINYYTFSYQTRQSPISRVTLSLGHCESIEQKLCESVRVVALNAWRKSQLQALFEILFGNEQIGSHGLVHLHVLWFAVLCGGGVVLGVVMLPLVGLAWEYCGKALVLPLEQLAMQQKQQQPQYLYGVDIRDSQAFQDPEVLVAAEYASFHHQDQTRKTGEPYIVHCIQTALIVEQYLICARVQGGPMLKNVVIAAILHDVVSDAKANQEEIHEKFGAYICELVCEVSNMSAINQLMRRTRRHGSGRALTEPKILEMILNGTRNPFSIIIKLADRVHNMRSAYILKADRQIAIAAETQSLWCRLAEKLGLFELKSELEDLCFAILHPEEFRKILAGLNTLWGPRVNQGQVPQQSIVSSLLPFNQDILSPQYYSEQPKLKSPFLNIPIQQTTFEKPLTEEQQQTKWLLKNILPFHYSYFQQVLYSSHSQEALKILGSCAQQLYQEIRLEGAAVGHDVEIYGRIKSLYSMYKKMNRKKIPLEEVYDARALRVIVDDSDAEFNSESAIRVCYRLLPLVQRLWKKIPREDDDYIANPKRQTGYQSLHTAVVAPDGFPLEVQIRTRTMHLAAEYGQAAHWVYKENESNVHNCDCVVDPSHQIQTGHPVLKVNNGNLWDGVVVSSEKDTLQVAIWLPFRLRKSSGTRAPLYKYTNLYRYALSNNLLTEENGYDIFMKIETYTNKDDRYCLTDCYGKRYCDRYLSILELCPQELQLTQTLLQNAILDEQESKQNNRSQNLLYPFNLSKRNFRMEMEDYGIYTAPASSSSATDSETDPSTTDQNSNQKIQLQLEQKINNNQQKQQQQNQSQQQQQFSTDDISARSILRLRQQLGSIEYEGDLQQKEQYISVFTWPDGDVSQIEAGTTAEDLIRNMGKITIVNPDETINSPKDVININNQLVSPKTVLKNGDYIVLGDQILDI